MTRDYFLEYVTTIGELREFCYDEECDLLDDIYDEDGRDECINECLLDWAENNTWDELYSRLDEIPTGYEWYRYDDYGEWVGLTDYDDFNGLRDMVLEWMDDGGYWDDDENDDSEPEYIENNGRYDESDIDVFAEELARDKANVDEPAPKEDFSVGDLIGMCGVAFVAIQDDSRKRIKEEEKQFGKFVDMNMPKVLR